MQIYHDFPSEQLADSTFLTIGNFDGLHRGHQRLIEDLIYCAHAHGALAGVLTFDPHPLQVLHPTAPFARIAEPALRNEIMEALGVDLLVVLPFDMDLAALSATQFVTKLVELLRLRSLTVGPDFALGRGREGTPDRLKELGLNMGFELHVLPDYSIDGLSVRSSRIRSLISQDGAVGEAAALLGRPFELRGEVVHGAHRGHQLGFPTANMSVSDTCLIPAYGVYACWAWIAERGYPAVANIGVRPSFDNGHPSIEAHIIGFDGDLYGQQLALTFHRRLRGEKRFDDISELVLQVKRDTAEAADILTTPIGSVDATGSWSELPHTADVAIAVRATSRPGLYALAASAMASLQQADATQHYELARRIRVTAGSAGEVMVSFLSAILSNQDTYGELYAGCHVSAVSDSGLQAAVYGYAGSPIHTAIKAVTYYDLDVRRDESGWSARVTFDV